MISRFVRSLRVVAFNSSPRVGSNCGILVDRMLAVLQKKGIEGEHIQFGREIIAGCQACNPPRCKDGECFQDDDVINEYARKMREADGIILASPTYYAGINANMKALIDRCGYQLMASSRPGHNPLRRKVGVGIGVHRRGGATSTVSQLNYFFMISGVIIPGSTYWNFGVGMMPGDVEADAEAMKNMDDLALNMAFVMRHTAAHRDEE